MKMDFYKDEWDEFEANCGFTDVELAIVKFLRRGWACIDIAAELNYSHSTIKNKRAKIGKKIAHYLAKTG